MLNVKLLVTLYFFIVGTDSSEYCKLCLNHTLCKYPVPGPSDACEDYDTSAHLSRDDIIEIVNRINERRNFVALGLSKRFPAAANMRKISWSEDLSWSAQRWVDQCDPAIRPDRHDQCRNLKNVAVGQIIATIIGSSPGLSVKSFVDIWFMQTLYYFGSVSYYNQSEGQKTNYLTQLVWAETSSVGCGKAKFYIPQKAALVERLVCNFAPSGNINGKPVYAIGFPATQCPDNYTPDKAYPGLCQFKNAGQTEPDLLKILNLSQSAVKQNIDPVRDNNKPPPLDVIHDNEYRHQKSRHVVNNSQVNFSGFISLPQSWQNFTTSFMQYHPPERVHHNHDLEGNIIPYTTLADNFKRFHLINQPLTIQDSAVTVNYRKFLPMNICSRYQMKTTTSNTPSECVTNRCTRGEINNCGTFTPQCVSEVPPRNVYSNPCSPLTPCSQHQLPSSSYTTPTCLCPCHTPATCCPLIASEQGDMRNSPDINYYDLFPHIALRSGDSVGKSQHKETYATAEKKTWSTRNLSPKVDRLKTIKKKRKEYLLKRNQFQARNFDEANFMDKEHEYSYVPKQKREYLRQIDDYENKSPLRSLRYTTLKNIKNRNTRKSTSITEAITIEPKANDEHNDHTKHGTEKYLSFEELMHLRKINSDEFSARRSNIKSTKATTTTTKVSTTTETRQITKQMPQVTISSSKSLRRNSKKFLREEVSPPSSPNPDEYSASPPFKRKKFCTRKLTCTWTVWTGTGADGKAIGPPDGGGAGQGGGSRTPPGYVEGCTRTSTCTRDFMNRNKISTIPISTMVPNGDEAPEEDYCE